MSGERADLHDEMRRLIAEDAPGPDEHPDPEELVDYHERRLSGPRADELQEHIAACPECASLVLEYSRDWAPGAATGGDGDRAFETLAWRRRVGVWQALAAALAVVAVGLGLWIAVGEPGRRDGGIRGVYMAADLSPEGTATRGGTAPPLTIPLGTRDVALVLPAEGLEAGVEYGIELRAGEKVVERARDLRAETGEALTVLVDADLLEPGSYEATLLRFGEGAATGEQVETYVFTVERQEAGAEP